MTLTELKYIIAVADLRHFGRAAEACFVSQPTLSAGIKKLEQEFDIVLFERSDKHDIHVTPEGEKLVEQARKIMSETQLFQQMAKAEVDPLVGPLKLGVIYSIAPYLLPNLIPTFKTKAPKIPLFIEENFTHNLTELLKQGKIDVAIIALPYDIPGIVTQEIYDEPFVVALPNTHEWRKRRSINVDDIDTKSLFMLGPGHCFRDQVQAVCPQCHSTTATDNEELRGSSLETICHMVATGAGISILPATAVKHHSDSKLLITKPFQKPIPSRRIALAWRRNFARVKAVEVLRESLLSSDLAEVKMLPKSKAR